MADYPDSTWARHQWWETLNREKLQSVVFYLRKWFFYVTMLSSSLIRKTSNCIIWNMSYFLLGISIFNKYFCVQITVIQTKEQVSDLFKTRSLLNCNTY